MNVRLKTWLALGALLLTSIEIFGAEKELFIDYTIKGGIAVMDVSIEIEQKTNAVRIRETRMRGVKETIDYKTVLTDGERAKFVEAIREVEFFKNPEKEFQLVHSHSGISTLTVSLDGNNLSRSYRDEPKLAPVYQLLWLLINQARAVHSLRPEGNAYSSSAKVLQPEALKAPLKEYFRTQKEWSHTKTALENFARITSAEEFHEFVVAGLKTGAPERDNLLRLIATHPFSGNIPRGHLQALLPVFLNFVNTSGIPHKLDDDESQAFDQFLRMLGNWHYEDTIPVLVSGFERHTIPGVTTYQTPLSSMGLAGLKAIYPFLDSALPNHRSNAIKLLVIASRTGPSSGITHPVSEAEYRKMKPYFETTVIPKLATIAKQESGGTKQSEEAINEIQSWLAK